MAKIKIMEHPLIQHKIGIIRRKETSSKEFRELVSEIAMFMAYEATRDLKLTDIEIETPLQKTVVKELAGKKLAVVPILRAGLGMVEGMLAMVPAAKVGHIGLYRDPETLKPVEYYCKLPASICNRPDACNRWFCDCCDYDVKRKRSKQHPFPLSACCTGRIKSTKRSTSGC